MCKTLGKYIPGSQQLFKHSRTFRDRNGRILKKVKKIGYKIIEKQI